MGQVQQLHRNKYVHRINHVGQDNSDKRGKCNKRNDRQGECSNCNRSDSSRHNLHRQPLHPRGGDYNCGHSPSECAIGDRMHDGS